MDSNSAQVRKSSGAGGANNHKLEMMYLINEYPVAAISTLLAIDHAGKIITDDDKIRTAIDTDATPQAHTIREPCRNRSPSWSTFGRAVMPCPLEGIQKRRRRFAPMPSPQYEVYDYCSGKCAEEKEPKKKATPLELAIALQHNIRPFYTLCHGLLAGLGLTHSILTIAPQDTLQNFPPLHTPAPTPVVGTPRKRKFTQVIVKDLPPKPTPGYDRMGHMQLLQNYQIPRHAAILAQHHPPAHLQQNPTTSRQPLSQQTLFIGVKELKMDVIEISSDSSVPPSVPASPLSDRLGDNFDTPEIDCDVESNELLNLNGLSSWGSPSKTVNVNTEVYNHSSGTEEERIQSRAVPVHVLSSSDDSDSEITLKSSDPLETYSRRRIVPPSISVTDWDETEATNKPSSSCQGKKKKRVTATKAAAAKAERERKAAERKQRQLEAQQEKALKKAASIAQRVNRPGECLKYIQVMLDQSLLTDEFGGELLLALQNAELQYTIQEQVAPRTITWVRSVQEHTLDENMKVQVRSTPKEEDEVLVIFLWDKFVQLVHSQTLRAHIHSICSFYQGKKLTLVVFGLGEYLRFHKLQKQRDVKAKVRGDAIGLSGKAARKEAAYRDAPFVTRQEVETALAELQVFEGCCHRLIDQALDLGDTVAQFTKAIAERPFKLEKQKKESSKLEWYATGDSRDCVRVDKNGLGLSRLWQQQLCQFPLVALDVAEAIVSQYPSPVALMEAYDRCSTQEEGEQLLKDIPIRRGVGPLTSVRKVGPELSRKMYVFFNAIDGNTPLSLE
ncbi:probable crossover junction endonuclease EME2 [Anabrus simplex]|uniref:probable crossover junction endonuclease EME2 n=1 Tax=Anabrus simplex TaxID=316456 RepID=UPI0035A2D2BF